MTDIYRDTDERYQCDPAFHAAVRTMEAIAREHGFTPGELKQIAFKAALNIEMTRTAAPTMRCECGNSVTYPNADGDVSCACGRSFKFQQVNGALGASWAVICFGKSEERSKVER